MSFPIERNLAQLTTEANQAERTTQEHPFHTDIRNSHEASVQHPDVQTNPKYEDIIIIDNAQEVANLFLKDSIIIWYTPDLISSDKQKYYLKELETLCPTRIFTDWKETSDFIRKQDSICHLIIRDFNEGLFAKEVIKESDNNLFAIYMECPDKSDDNKLIQQYPKIKSIENTMEELLPKIKENLVFRQKEKPIFKISLPAFAPVFNSTDKSEMNYLHLRLKGLVQFCNRTQAQRDFLKISEALFCDRAQMEEFQKNYCEYNMREILYWYTRESFLYKVTNNLLRLAKSDSILYCRLVLKDIETSIKEQYELKSKSFNGLLYRGAYLSEEEWTKLEENVDKDIEMYGFLSTTKKKGIAERFVLEDPLKKVLVTIIVLPGEDLKDQQQQGFAEVKEFSEYKAEEEVLFNIRSRFTVLETSFQILEGIKCRHLVLLYGKQAWRRKLHEIQPHYYELGKKKESMTCEICEDNDESKKIFHVSLRDSGFVICGECVRIEKNKKIVLDKGPFWVQGKQGKNEKLLEGVVMKFNDGVKIPFYGYKCKECSGSGSGGENKKENCYYYTCIESKEKWCFECGVKKDCLENGHNVILEQSPWSFWYEKISEKELLHLEHQEKIFQEDDHMLIHGKVFEKTHELEKAEEFWKTVIKRYGQFAQAYYELAWVYIQKEDYKKAIDPLNKGLEICESPVEGISDLSDLVICYYYLGVVYEGLGESHKALDFAVKSTEINRLIYGEVHAQTASSYGLLSGIYRQLQNFREAIEWLNKSFEIEKKIYGEDNPIHLDGYYTKMGSLYDHLEEYPKAIEHFQKNVEINLLYNGEKHTDTARAYNNLGGIYREQGKFELSIEYHLKALNIYQQLVSENDPKIASALQNLGDIYRQSGHYDQALDCEEKALAIWRATYGAKHPKIADSYNNFGLIYGNLSNRKKSIEYHKKALEMRQLFYEENHYEIANSRCNLANEYNHIKEYSLAKENFTKAFEIFKVAFGENHLRTMRPLNGLGLLHGHLKEYAEAAECFEKALAIVRSKFGEMHPDTAGVLDNLGCSYYELGEYEKARECHEKSLNLRRSLYSGNHYALVSSLLGFGACCGEMGESSKMEECYEEGIEMARELFGENGVMMGECFNGIGKAYENLGEFLIAIGYYVKAVEVFCFRREEGDGEMIEKVRELYEKIGNLYELSADEKNAKVFRDKAKSLENLVLDLRKNW